MSNMNRLHNSNNPYQGPARRVLCVCSAGLLRSPTAAVVLQREFGYNTRSAGLEENFALIPVDNVLLAWAEEVVVMNHGQALEVKSRKSDALVVNLNVPDDYSYMDEELQEIIKNTYQAVGL